MEIDVKRKKRKREEHTNLMSEESCRRMTTSAEKRKKINKVSRDGEDKIQDDKLEKRAEDPENCFKDVEMVPKEPEADAEEEGITESEKQREEKDMEGDGLIFSKKRAEKLVGEKLKPERQHVKALEEIVHKLQREMLVLTGKVKMITEENRQLKTWARTIVAKMGLKDEDEEDVRVWDRIEERAIEGSPTPTYKSPQEVNQLSEVLHSRENKSQKKSTEEVENMSEDAEEECELERRENRVEKKKFDSEKRLNRRNHFKQNEESEMEVEDDAEAARQKPVIEDADHIDHRLKDIHHRAFLE